MGAIGTIGAVVGVVGAVVGVGGPPALRVPVQERVDGAEQRRRQRPPPASPWAVAGRDLVVTPPGPARSSLANLERHRIRQRLGRGSAAQRVAVQVQEAVQLGKGQPPVGPKNRQAGGPEPSPAQVDRVVAGGRQRWLVRSGRHPAPVAVEIPEQVVCELHLPEDPPSLTGPLDGLLIVGVEHRSEVDEMLVQLRSALDVERRTSDVVDGGERDHRVAPSRRDRDARATHATGSGGRPAPPMGWTWGGRSKPVGVSMPDGLSMLPDGCYAVPTPGQLRPHSHRFDIDSVAMWRRWTCRPGGCG